MIDDDGIVRLEHDWLYIWILSYLALVNDIVFTSFADHIQSFSLSLSRKLYVVMWPLIELAHYILVELLNLILLGYLHKRKVNMKTDGRLILITGCDSGFGFQTAQELSNKGFSVIAVCLTQEGLSRVKSFTFHGILCDITKEKDLQDLSRRLEEIILASQGTLWAVINNAGVAPGGYMDWLSTESCRKAMEVNYFGLLSITKRTLPFLKKVRNSRIINISSMAGVIGGCNLGAYCGN